MDYLVENKHTLEKAQLQKMQELWKFENLCIEMLSKEGINYNSIRKFCRAHWQSAKLWDIDKVYNQIKAKDSTIELNKEWSMNYIKYFKKYYIEIPFDTTWTNEMNDHYKVLSECDKAFFDVMLDFERSLQTHFKDCSVKELCDTLKKNEKYRQIYLLKILENWSFNARN